MGRKGLELALQNGGSQDKGRTQVIFCAIVAGYDAVHYGANESRVEEAIKYGHAVGDRYVPIRLSNPYPPLIVSSGRTRRVLPLCYVRVLITCYQAFALLHRETIRLFSCNHLADLVISAEEVRTSCALLNHR
jgi:hypothetical protein